MAGHRNKQNAIEDVCCEVVSQILYLLMNIGEASTPMMQLFQNTRVRVCQFSRVTSTCNAISKG